MKYKQHNLLVLLQTGSLTQPVVDESSVVESYFKATVGLYGRAIIFYGLIKVHPEVLYLSAVVKGSSHNPGFTSPVDTQGVWL